MGYGSTGGSRIPYFQPLRHKGDDLVPKGAEQPDTTGTHDGSPPPSEAHDGSPLPNEAHDESPQSKEANDRYKERSTMTNDVPIEPEAESQSLVQMMARMMSQMDDIRRSSAVPHIANLKTSSGECTIFGSP